MVPKSIPTAGPILIYVKEEKREERSREMMGERVRIFSQEEEMIPVMILRGMMGNGSFAIEIAGK